ncbi:MAG: hypothetical protein F6K26_54450 [Moorea sp. SIO2I5]|nr:hypothetical protein [Moorena sp. SIO2I5]
MDKKKSDDRKFDSLSLSPKGNREQGIGNREQRLIATGNSRKELEGFFGVMKKRCSAVLTTLHRYSLLPTPYSLLPTP